MTAAKQRVADAVAGARPVGRRRGGGDGGDSLHGLPPGCPVRPLGLMGDVRFYLDAAGQLAQLPAGKHIRTELLGLFGHRSDFIYSQDDWVRRNPEGSVTGWRPEIVAEAFIRANGRAGVWDAAKKTRGRGAWLGDDGELIVHTGDAVMIFEATRDAWSLRQSHPPGLFGGYVYPTGDRAGTPAETDDPSADPGDELMQLLETWNWRRGDLDAMLMLGWICAAMIGGALKWRPAVWLTGSRGTGKSTLQQELIKPLFDGMLIDVADTSPAFIYQTLGSQTLPVNVDELEPEADNRRVMGVIKLARIAASGGRMGRGSDKHVAVDFTLRSCFMFSSVLIPPMMGPDRSRLAILELDELRAGTRLPDLKASRLKRIGAHLRRRLIENWPAVNETIGRYNELLRAAGHDSRAADQFGTLLGMADVALSRGHPDPDAAQDWVSRIKPGVLLETSDDIADEYHCLHHLLATPLDAYKKGERQSVGHWVNLAAGRMPDIDDVREARKVIGTYGLRIEVIGQQAFLAVANSHRGLQGIFDKTTWNSPAGMKGVWTQSLGRLPGARRGDQALYFGGITARCVLIPLGLVPESDLARAPALPTT
ncbi:hypothetical protein UFOVP843_10 [uncultured Caudovirales phage]|uniref:Uncharacterized protein n=1 Tax=uncultured Caudovirales phage TaxID=2100421 RepID=A0A6J5PLK7_9CAUD|nr:hypothetical protein UFOVP843_10 [uncultured Caudovirales phage]CAB4172473.1 hypothetical protein UFOVP936_27 [uncultured Caudovirales phage]